MEIINLINMDKQNETVNEKRNALWKRLFFLTIGNILLLYFLIFTDGTSDMGDYLYQNLRIFSDRDSDPVVAEGKRAVAYYDYDVYMGISDYNRLREMLDLTPVTLQDDQYLIHMANRVYQEIKDKSAELPDSLNIGLDFAEFKTEGFAQNGHNGTDYLLVVPDKKRHPSNQIPFVSKGQLRS